MGVHVVTQVRLRVCVSMCLFLHCIALTTNITLAHYANSLITCESSHQTQVLFGNDYGYELPVEQLFASDRQ